jgi:hypothetical protein
VGQWGAWVAEITNRNTHRKVWIGSFQSPEQAAYAYDLENLQHKSEIRPTFGCNMYKSIKMK